MKKERKNHIGKQTRIRSSHLLAGTIIIAVFFLVLNSSDVAIEYMKKGLILCSSTVIPSLFPFMIISELIVSSGIGARISRIFVRPMKFLFGVSESGAAAYLLGTVCGFPIGAKTAVSMYDKGMMEKHELEQLLTFCNNPGSAFIISAVGVSLLGNKTIGVLIYFCIILSSLIVGFVGKFFFAKSDTRRCYISNECAGFSVKEMTDAVQSSAISMLTVCAYVVFFSALVGCMGAFLSEISLPYEILACIFGFFELSSGVGAAADVTSKLHSILLCALFSGWSGMSVHLQIMSVCSGRNISFKPYLIAKGAQGIICASLVGIAVKFVFPSMLIPSSQNLPVYEINTDYVVLPTLLCIISILISVSLICIKRGSNLSRKLNSLSKYDKNF